MVEVNARLVDEITERVLARLTAESAAGGATAGESTLRHLVDHGACRVGCRARATSLPAELASTIDHTLLKPDATLDAILQLCAEAREFSFASVCVNPTWVRTCAEDLAGSGVEICTVIGFPLGATTSAAKAAETRIAVADGATEVDMVLNVGALKSGFLELVRDDIRAVVAAAADACVKVILETVLLSDEEKVAACALAQDADAHYVKTSTGFAGGGATVEDIALMRRVVRGSMGVKASGGVRDRAGAEAMIAAGANRIGASAGVKIVRGETSASGAY